MPFLFDESTRAITMAAGDTADIYVAVDWIGIADGDAILFGVFNPNTGEDVLVKAVDTVDDKVHIRLCNHDTRDLPAGRYKYQVRIVTNPARDENGNVIADDCTDNVISLFNQGEIPSFTVNRTGARV